MESQFNPNLDSDEEENNYQKVNLQQILEQNISSKSDKLNQTEMDLAKKKDEYSHKMINSFSTQKAKLENSKKETLSKLEQGLMIEQAETFLHTFKKTELFQQVLAKTLQSLINIQTNLSNEKEEIIKQKNPVTIFFNNHEKEFNDINIDKKSIQKILLSDGRKLEIVLKSKDNEEAIKSIKEESSSVYSTFMENIDTEMFVGIFIGNEPVNLDKNVILKINNCNLEHLSLGKHFEKTKKVFMKNCLELFGEVKLFDYFNRLKVLSLKNCNIITYTFDYIMKHLVSYKNSLEYLSFKHNRITKVSFPLDENGGSVVNFSNIKELNFEGNRIYRFESSALCAPEMNSKFRVIYLSSNNFAFKDNFNSLVEACKSREKIMEETNPGKKRVDFRILVMITRNLFLLRDDNKKEYIEYLNKTLSDFNYPLKYLTLEMLFNTFNKESLFSINISNTVQEKLLHLNLSYCTLENKELISFISKYSFVSLVKLNVSFNNLTYDFFKEYSELKLNEKLPSLMKIDFTGNENMDVKSEGDYNGFISFTVVNSNLKKIFFMKTVFDRMVQSFINNKYKIIGKDKKISEVKKDIEKYKVSEKEKEIDDEITKIVNLVESQGNQSVKFVFRSLRSDTTVKRVRECFDKLFQYFEFKDRVYSIE